MAAPVADASVAPSASTTSVPRNCAIATSGDVRVHLINEAGAAPEMLDAAESEASAIWASAGLHLMWTSAHRPTERTDDCGLVVIVRRTLSRPRISDAVDSEVRSRALLGRIAFGENGRPGNLIEVSLTVLTSRVMGASQQGVPISNRPAFIQMLLLGRGLGRVVAHEIGHWVLGRGHTRDGLMQASFDISELLERTAPTLPRPATIAARACPMAISARAPL
jgi:hypothetical protein